MWRLLISMLVVVFGFFLLDTQYTNELLLNGKRERSGDLSMEGSVMLDPNETLQPGELEVAALRIGDRQGRRLWALSNAYAYCYDSSNEIVVVPAHFVTDMASIPRLARFLYDPADFAEAAVVHDWIYAVGEPGRRNDADNIMRSMLVETGHSTRRANIVHFVVSKFGAKGYGLDDDFLFFDFDADDNEDKFITELRRPETAFRTVGSCEHFAE